jgi:hypothetical protein
VRGDRLFGRDGATIRLTTLCAAAHFAGIELSPDPGVGRDLPPYTPDVPLRVQPAASIALGAWYAFGQSVFDELLDRELRRRVTPQIWPEHFDLAITLDLADRTNVTIGFSPGDAFQKEPYVYVSPQDPSRVTGTFWNAPFGARLDYRDLASGDPRREALDFIEAGLSLASP